MSVTTYLNWVPTTYIMTVNDMVVLSSTTSCVVRKRPGNRSQREENPTRLSLSNKSYFDIIDVKSFTDASEISSKIVLFL